MPPPWASSAASGPDVPPEMRDKAAGFLILRAFFAQFWLLQCFGKLYDQESGVAAWRNLAIWSRHTTEWFVKQTVLPGWLVHPYTAVLPYVELTLGLCFLLGFQTRRTILTAAALLISLDAGLLLQLKHDVVAMNTVYLLALLLALRWEPHQRWSIDSWWR